jgi:hypothetical protein
LILYSKPVVSRFHIKDIEAQGFSLLHYPLPFDLLLRLYRMVSMLALTPSLP